MSTSNLPVGNALGLEPDEAQRKSWSESMARLEVQLSKVASTAMLPRTEFTRVSTLTEAVKSARHVLATI